MSQIAIFSSIHGNEKSGTKALMRLFEEFQKGKLQYKPTKQLFAKYECNKEAFDKNVRFIEKNLNRCFIPGNNGTTYEDEIARDLMQILDESEMLLDLHSTSGPSIPFMFAEYENLEIAKQLGCSHIITGWKNIGGDTLSGDTENYMNNQGKVGFTFEAGDHDSIDGEENSYQMILNYLVYHGVLGKNYFKKIGGEDFIVDMKYMYVLQTNEWEYEIENLNNFRELTPGMLIGFDGRKPVFENSGVKNPILIMPKTADFGVGVEVFFIGERIN